MEKTGWKITAIVFIALFLLTVLYLIWGMSLYYQIEENTKICYYEFCKNYANALYDDGICYCYDYDILGELVVVDTKIMK